MPPRSSGEVPVLRSSTKKPGPVGASSLMTMEGMGGGIGKLSEPGVPPDWALTRQLAASVEAESARSLARVDPEPSAPAGQSPESLKASTSMMPPLRFRRRMESS